MGLKVEYAVSNSTKAGPTSTLNSYNQSFVPDRNFTMDDFAISIDAIPSGFAMAYIYMLADNEGIPGSGLVAPDGYVGSIWTNSTGWQGDWELGAGQGPDLEAGTKYWIRIKGLNLSDPYDLDFDNTDSYADGTCLYWDGIQYVAQNGDLNFRIYGTYTPVITDARISSDGTSIVATGEGGVFISTDLGSNWTEYLPDDDGSTNWSKCACDADASVIIVWDENNNIYRSADSGSTWAQITPAGGDTYNVNDIEISDTGQYAIIAGTNETDFPHSCFTSTDYGATWTEHNPVNEDTVYGDNTAWWECFIDDTGNVMGVTRPSSGLFYISFDGGTTWTNQNIPASTVDRSVIAVSGDGKLGLVCNTGTNNEVFMNTGYHSELIISNTSLTSAGRDILDDATPAAQVTTLGFTETAGDISDHIFGDGSDHTFVEQDVTTTADATMNSLTLSGLSVSSLVGTDGAKKLTTSVTGLSPTFVTVDLTGITDGNIPYMGASGFADSAVSFDGTNIGVNIASPTSLFDLNVASGENGYRLTSDSVAIARWDIANAGVDNSVRFGTITNNEIQFYTNSVKSMTLTTAQNLNVVGDVTGANLNISNWDAAYTHVSSDGSDHTFIDQDVSTSASPSFAGGDLTNITDGYVPYISAGGFADSAIWTDGTYVGVGTSTPGTSIGGHITPSYTPRFEIAGATPEFVIDGTASATMYFGDSGAGDNDAIYNIHWNGPNLKLQSINDNNTVRYLHMTLEGDTGLVDVGSTLYIDTANGKVGIGESSPSTLLHIHATTGNDVEVYLSDADVSHPFTDFAESDVFMRLGPSNSTTGGATVEGYTDLSTNAMLFQGHLGTATPTHPAIKFVGYKTDGSTGRTNLANTEKVIQFFNGSSDLLTILGEGSFGFNTTTPGDSIGGHISPSFSNFLELAGTTVGLVLDGTTSADMYFADSGAAANGSIFNLNFNGPDFTMRSINDNNTIRYTCVTMEGDTGLVDVPNDFTAGTIQADNGYTGSWVNNEGNTVTVVGGVITDVS